jgi:23S rRNA pseudouridine1911/1915/1917 synthase
MLRDCEIEVRVDEAGMRLDRVILGRFTGTSRALVLDAIERGAVRVNGRVAPKGQKLSAGDRVHVDEIAEQSDVRVTPNPDLPLCVIYEDDALLAMNKPAGLPVHPLDYRETDTLANAMIARYPALAAIGDHPLMPALLHRIDTATSGLVLAAKTAPAYAHLWDQFRRQTVRKVYLAVVQGQMSAEGRMESQLIHRPGEQHRMAVLGDRPPPAGQRPMRAVTAFEPLRSGGGLTLLQVTIFTGVTHQIRCQLAALGHPIVGDDLYGPAGTPPAAKRLFLHAAEIACRHPTDGRDVTLTCPPPQAFSVLLP